MDRKEGYRNKKILFVINTLGGGGAEKALIQLLKQISPEEYDVSLLVLLGQGERIHEVPAYVNICNTDYSDASVLSREGKRILIRHVLKRMFSGMSIVKNARYLMKNLHYMRKVQKKVNVEKLLWRVMADGVPPLQETYDLAVAYLEGGATYYVQRHVQAVQKAAFVHVDYGQAGYFRGLDQGCYDTFDRIFTVSEEVKEGFLRVYPEYWKKTDLFYNQMDQQEIRALAKEPGGFTDDYPGKRILTVGRLTEQKGYEIALKAMKLLVEKGYEARWYVLGEGNQREKLQRQIRQLGLEANFLLPGAVDNPYPYYAQCDLYVHATRFEGKSIAVQEAQTLGCAILVSDTDGNREQVKDGYDGAVCSLNAVSICHAVEHLLSDDELRKIYGKRAAEIVPKTENVKKLFGIEV